MISNWFNKLKIEDSHPTEETLLACADGELSDREAAKIRRHLENCWSCRAQLDELQETITLFVNFRSQIQNPLADPPPGNWNDFGRKLAQAAAENAGEKFAVPNRPGFRQKFRRSLNFGGWSPARKQFGIGAATAAILIAALVWQMIGARNISAAEILDNAIRSEEKKIARVDQPVVYQKLRLERIGDQTVEWETWHDKLNSRYRHALASSGNRRFIPAVFNPGKNDAPDAPILREAAAILQANRMNAEQPLSAESFQIWRGSLTEKRDEIENSRSNDGGQGYILKTVAAGEAENGKITEAALTVDADNWHAERLRVSVKNAGGASIYEFVETEFEVVSLSSLDAGIFPRRAPPAKTEIVSAAPAAKSSPASSPSAAIENNAPADVQPAPAGESASSSAATVELEVAVLKALGDIGADIGEEATVTRSGAGGLIVQGVVETAKRKSEILSALAPLKNEPGLSFRIETSQEAQKRVARERAAVVKNRQRAQPAEAEISAQPLEFRDQIPADAEVRRYLRSRGTAENLLNDEVNRFAARAVSRSNQIALRAAALKNLAGRFSESQLRLMKPEARNEWLNLIARRASEIEIRNGALRQELGAVFGNTAANGASVEAVGDEAGLRRAAARLSELAASNDRAIRAAFTFSSGANADAVKSASLRQSLGSIEGLANDIESFARRLQNK